MILYDVEIEIKIQGIDVPMESERNWKLRWEIEEIGVVGWEMGEKFIGADRNSEVREILSEIENK